MAEEKKKVGRPNTGLKRKNIITFRVNDEEEKMIKIMADREGSSVANYLFRKVFCENKEYVEEIRKLVKEEKN